MKPVTEVKVKYGVWGLILGAGAAMIIGFNWGGWTTRGTSQGITEAAVLTARGLATLLPTSRSGPTRSSSVPRTPSE